MKWSPFLSTGEKSWSRTGGWITGGLATIDLLDALADKRRVGDEFVGCRATAKIPVADLVQLPAGQPGHGSRFQAAFTQVLVLVLPSVANGSVHVGYMQLARAGQDPLCECMTGRQDKIEAAEIELLDRKRHQRQVAPEVAPRERQVLDEGSFDGDIPQKPAILLGHHVNQREQARLRKA